MLPIEHVQRAVPGDVERLGLVVVVLQHQFSDFIGHGGEQVVALFEREVTRLHDGAQQNLDVDFVVRAVHAGGVVNRVGVEQPAFLRKLNPAHLGATQIATLGQHLAAQIGTVDSERVAGFVAHLGVGLETGLDIGANAAVVQQVNRRLQNGAQNVHGCQCFCIHP